MGKVFIILIKGKHEGSIKAVYYDENNQNDFFWGKNEIE